MEETFHGFAASLNWFSQILVFCLRFKFPTYISDQTHCEVFDNLSLCERNCQLAAKILYLCYHPKTQEDRQFCLKHSGKRVWLVNRNF